jgi:ABC-type transporter MlaC component
MDGIRIATLAVLSVDTLVVILLAVFLVTNVQSQRQVNECYQDQADQMLSAITAGRQAAAQDRAAQLAMLNTILDPGSSPEARRASVEGWRQALDEADRTRSTAPVPTQRCAR